MHRLKVAHAKSQRFCGLVSGRRQLLGLLGPRLPSSKQTRMWCLRDLLEKQGGWGGETSVYSSTTCPSLLLGQSDTGRMMLWEFFFFLNLNVKDLVGGKEISKQVDLYFFNPFLIAMQQLSWTNQAEGGLKLVLAEETTQRLLLN